MTTQQTVRIAFDDTGAGDPTVVLLHGFLANRTYYAAQVQHLAARYRVLNIDLRGHGDSEVPEQGYSLDILADDVIRVCDEARITRAVFCGHSMAVALKVAVRRPDLAAGLVLLDGAVLIPPEVREQQRRLADALQTDGWREALLGFFPSNAESARERVRADIAVAPRCYAEPLLRDVAASDFASELATLACPLMYVHSRIPADLNRLGSLRPDAMIEEIPGVGHYPMLTAPERVTALVEQFCDSIRSMG